MAAVVREINGHLIGVNPNKPRQILFDQNDMPKNLLGPFDVKEIVQFLSHGVSHSPLVLKHEITSLCELSCPFCYIKGHVPGKHTAFAEAKEMYDWLLEQGLIYAILTGGNPTLNPDFPLIYRYLKEHGVFVDIYTNGLSFTDEIFSLLAELPPRSVEITFYDTDDVRPEPFRVAEKLVDMGIHVLAKVTVAKKTKYAVGEVSTWARKHGVRVSLDNDLFDARDGEAVSNLAAKKPRKYRMKRADEARNKVGAIPTAFGCSAGFCSVFIDSQGRLGICPRSNMRFDGALPEAYEKLKAHVEEHKRTFFNERCNTCAKARACHMCVARAEFKNGRYCIPEGWCEAHTLRS